MNNQVEPAAVAEVRQAYRYGHEIRMPIAAQKRTRIRKAIHAVLREDVRGVAERKGMTLKAVRNEATRILEARKVEHGAAWFHTFMHGSRIPEADQIAALATAMGVEMSAIDAHLRLASWTTPNAMLAVPDEPKRRRRAKATGPTRRPGRPRKNEPAIDTAAPAIDTAAPEATPAASPKTEVPPAMPEPPRPDWPNPDAFGIERPRWERGGLEIVTTDGAPFSQTILTMAEGDPVMLRKMAFSLETTATILRTWAERADMQMQEFGPKG